MRKENFLTAMLNKDVLDLRLPMPWLGDRVMLTKILEWNLYWCARPAPHRASSELVCFPQPPLPRRRTTEHHCDLHRGLSTSTPQATVHIG